MAEAPNTWKKWSVHPLPAADAHLIFTELGPEMGPLEARLLYNRGLRTLADARRYLQPRLGHLSDPLALPEMEAAVDRISRAIANGELIGVFGDFDVDGLTGTAILLHTINDLGGAAVARIPHRDITGHGLDFESLQRMHRDGVSLLITVDTGSTDDAQVAYAATLGMDTVVTDHHVTRDRMEGAWAVVNPQLARCDGASSGAASLTGAGVALKLAQALYQRAGREWPSHLLALAALGTLADVGPLTGENRVIVSEGLRELATTSHPGLAALVAGSVQGQGGGELDAEAVTFGLIPRLNAPGRLGDARPSLELLTCSDPVTALALARHLGGINDERRRLSQEAWEMARAELAMMGTAAPVLVVGSAGFRAGILGPLAGRICGEHRKPAIAIALGETHARASARSMPGFNLHAAIEPSADRLDQFGGHARAAGFTVKLRHLRGVIDEIQERAANGFASEPEPDIVADAEVSFPDFTPQLWHFVRSIGPFGEANPAPVFVSRGLSPMQVRVMGQGGDHLRLVLEEGGMQWNAVGFGLGRADLGGGPVDAAYTFRTGYWRGRERRELHLLDIRPSVP